MNIYIYIYICMKKMYIYIYIYIYMNICIYTNMDKCFMTLYIRQQTNNRTFVSRFTKGSLGRALVIIGKAPWEHRYTELAKKIRASIQTICVIYIGSIFDIHVYIYIYIYMYVGSGVRV